MLVLFSSWIPGILENPLFFTFFLPFFHVFWGKSWFFTCWSCFPPGFPEFWKIIFFLHFFLPFFYFFFHVFWGKSWFFTCWSCFPPGFPEFWKIHFFLHFFYFFFTFSEVKVDFSHVGPVFLLDSRNFGKSTFFYLFFTFFSRFFLNWYFQAFHMKDSYKASVIVVSSQRSLLEQQHVASTTLQPEACVIWMVVLRCIKVIIVLYWFWLTMFHFRLACVNIWKQLETTSQAK